MNTKRTEDPELERIYAQAAYGEAARRFRAAQAEYDRTRVMSAEYLTAEDGFALAAKRWRKVRGY